MSSAGRCLLVTFAFALVLSPAAHATEIKFDRALQMLRVRDAATAVDNVTIRETGNTHEITDPSGALTDDTDPPAVCTAITNGFRCPKATSIAVDLGAQGDTFAAPTVTVPMAVAGGDGNDTLTGGGSHDVLTGGAGGDTLTGLGGFDEYFGEDDGDTIDSTDGLAERISCGGGTDQVRNDFVDIIAECERGFDVDRDGFSTAVDCNDAAATIFPGAREILENGIDEDCDGRDAVNLDRDADRFPVPVDCNDADPAIRPGTVEVRGNAVDENCDRQVEPFAPMRASLSTTWASLGTDTRLLTMIVRNAPAGAQITYGCTGRGKNCPFSRNRRATVPRDLAPVPLRGLTGKRRLRPGARITVVVSATGFVTRTFRYTIVRRSAPDFRSSCRAPGAPRSFSC